jgi:hypothetical protein
MVQADPFACNSRRPAPTRRPLLCSKPVYLRALLHDRALPARFLQQSGDIELDPGYLLARPSCPDDVHFPRRTPRNEIGEGF